MAANNPTPICLSCGGLNTAVSEDVPLQLLVATAEGLHEFRRPSADKPWHATGLVALEGSHPSAVAFEPRSGLLFAGHHFHGGLKVSADLGLTWRSCNTGITTEHIYCLAVQYVGDRTVLYAGTEPAGLFRSEDLGQHWEALPNLTNVPETYEWWFPFGIPHAKNVAFHPSEPDTLYVCIEQGDLLKSTDGGKSWNPTFFHSPMDRFRRDMHRLTIRESDAKQMFLTGGTGTHFSADAGKTWTQLTDGGFMVGYPDPFFISPDDENTLFVVGAGAPPNPNWSRLGTTDPAVARSRDGGKSWQRVMNGMPSPVRGNLEAAAMHRSPAGLELFVGSACGELYTSRDEGDSWTCVSTTLPAISKGAHFRHFLPEDQKRSYEEKLIASGAFRRQIRVEDKSLPPPTHRAGLPD